MLCLVEIVWYVKIRTHQLEQRPNTYWVQDHEQQCSYPLLQRRSRKNYREHAIHGCANSTETIGQSNDRGGHDITSDKTPPSCSSFAIPESRQTLIPSQSNLCGPSQPTPDVVKAARSADRLAAMEIAASPRSTRNFVYENETGDVSGRLPTPRDSEVDREEATMDLRAVR